MLYQLLFYIIITFFFSFIGILITKNNPKLILLSKFVGIVFFTVLLWLLGHLHYLYIPVSWQFIFYVFLVFTIASAPYLILKYKEAFLFYIKRLLAIEIWGLFIFLILNFFRTTNPSLMGTERPMDFSFIFNFTKQPHIPFENPWLTGAVLNYYYMGHFFISILILLTKLPPALVYNFSISLITVLIFQSIFLFISFTTELKTSIKTLISFALTFGGNLYVLFFSILPFIKNITLPEAPTPITSILKIIPIFYYPSATRVIKYTINEFFSYSSILGDLHGHFLAAPFFITSITLAWLLVKQINNTNKTSNTLLLLIIGVFAFFLFATNSWDTLTLIEIYTILLIINFKKLIRFIQQNYKSIIIAISVTLILTFLFKIFFITPLNGIGFSLQNKDYLKWHILWGQFIVLFIPAIYFMFKRNYTVKQQFLLTIGTIGLFNIVLVNFLYLKDVFSIVNPPYSRANTVFKIYYQSWFLLGSSALSLFYIMIAKINNITKKTISQVIFYTVCFIMFLFPMLAFSQNFPLDKYTLKANTFNFLSSRNIKHTVGNYLFFKEKYPYDYQILQYLIKKTKDFPAVTIAEVMTKESYSYYGRMAVYSGNRLITGWPFHNVQWYNGYTFTYYYFDPQNFLATRIKKQESIDNRLNDINSLYTSNRNNMVNVQKILHKYHVKYIVLGELEYNFYPTAQLQEADKVFSKLCTPVLIVNNKYKLFDCSNY